MEINDKKLIPSMLLFATLTFKQTYEEALKTYVLAEILSKNSNIKLKVIQEMN